MTQADRAEKLLIERAEKAEKEVERLRADNAGLRSDWAKELTASTALQAKVAESLRKGGKRK